VRWASDEDVVLVIRGKTVRGWLLNFSQGGLRVVIASDCLADCELDLVGFSVVWKFDNDTSREARVVWSQPGNAGVVLGMALHPLSARSGRGELEAQDACNR
jgi:hypothetical protein